ncbi:zymogen granule protein 16 homolog B [Grammomys surdaster]|uniref:zymogen granule protein 16 homolog B n=1 Tax=Grammomys surdaster TaxID=491861 RepID=UPI0010A0B8A5|nr:zymogen granule protein 16 homolog B [Grammomys surdaster]
MFQLEAMLPLLILAFLGTPVVLTESKSSYHGLESGKHFCTSAPEGKNVTGIRAFVKGLAIARIQLRFGQEWGKVYGGSGGNEAEVELENENIVGVFGTTSAFVNQVILLTDLGRQILLGSFRGRDDYSSFPKKPIYVLKGVCGYYVPGGIKGIKFLWGTLDSTCS